MLMYIYLFIYLLATTSTCKVRYLFPPSAAASLGIRPTVMSATVCCGHVKAIVLAGHTGPLLRCQVHVNVLRNRLSHNCTSNGSSARVLAGPVAWKDKNIVHATIVVVFFDGEHFTTVVRCEPVVKW